MRCFVHPGIEAVGACRVCGKGMCDNCSAYSGHTGICPECRKKEFEEEVSRNQASINDLKWGKIGFIILTVLLAITIVGFFYGIYNVVTHSREIEKLESRNRVLCSEIARLNKVIVRAGGSAFI